MTPPIRPSPPAPQGAAPRPPAKPKATRPGDAPPHAAPRRGAGWTDDALDALQALLDSLHPAREPLDVVMVDGFLCGVLLQPDPVPEDRWLPLVIDLEGRPPPRSFDLAALRTALHRRHVELDAAIRRRDWFDPWVYALDEAASPSEAVMPWVAGFATAVDSFGVLMARHSDELLEPLATLYRHLDPEDLEDADALLAEIDTYEPPADLAEAVEDLVRSVLLIADVSRPRRPASAPPPPARHRPR